MALSEAQALHSTQFREWLKGQLADDQRFGEPQIDDREDGSTLTTRWPIGENLYVEVALRPLIPQVRIGVVTDDRWQSEDLEQRVEDTGDSMGEFLEVPLAEAGLDWDEPPVEHYRSEGKWFAFITPLEPGEIAELADEPIRTKTMQLINGYYNAYGPGYKPL